MELGLALIVYAAGLIVFDRVTTYASRRLAAHKLSHEAHE